MVALWGHSVINKQTETNWTLDNDEFTLKMSTWRRKVCHIETKTSLGQMTTSVKRVWTVVFHFVQLYTTNFT